MKRLVPVLALLLMIPAAASAQPRVLVGGGFTAPNGNIGDVADPGYHLQASLQISLPTLPVSLRGDGSYHRLGSSQATFEDTRVLGGAASVVFHLPGVGLRPYVLGGIGSYRVEAGPASAPTTTTDTGYHGGFGVEVGGLSFAGYAEIRWVRVNAGANLIPLSLGFVF